MWLAGGGVKGGIGYGATDELGYHAVENVVHVRDLHATMLHLLGIDHERFTCKYQGLDMRLTGVEQARVVKESLDVRRTSPARGNGWASTACSHQLPPLAVLAADERVGLGAVRRLHAPPRPTRASCRRGRRRCRGGSPRSASRSTRSCTSSARRSCRRGSTRRGGPSDFGIDGSRPLEVGELLLRQQHVLAVVGQQHPLVADEQHAVGPLRDRLRPSRAPACPSPWYQVSFTGGRSPRGPYS